MSSLLRPDTSQAPQIKDQDTENNPAEYGSIFEVIFMLKGPIPINPKELTRSANHGQVAQLDEIVLDDFVLESHDHCEGGVE